MVENKKTKRERDIKSKLMAAIAMLLVSSIMMVSSTYAWFTLSTAPEVTGITTTIGANGNLEIALSPKSGLGSEVGDADLSTSADWTIRNLTWGNLVDMSSTTYGLAELTLSPAQLAATATTADGGTTYNLGDYALATPSYGSDGRISALNVNAGIAGKAEGATGYATTDADYGVRAVGTSSGMSAQQAKFKTSVNAIGTYANSAITAASNSLADNGNALASMLVQHAEAGSGDANNYALHIPALVAMTEDLEAVIPALDEALRSALIAAVCSEEDEAAFNVAVENLEAAADLDAMIAVIGEDNLPTGFDAIVAQRDAIAARISGAASAAEALMTEVTNEGGIQESTDSDGNVTYTTTAEITWTQVSDVLYDLMNTNGNIWISGYTIDEIKDHMNDMDFLLGLATDCQIQMGYDSGVYYDIAQMTGNIAAKTTATVTARQMTVTLKNVIIKTVFPDTTSTSETSTTPTLTALKTAINTNVTPAGSTTGAVLDAFYGYVIDLMVRTNAADSNLLLQTTPAQRVYEDSANESTMGKGTTIVFEAYSREDAYVVNDLCKSIRVVFFDPSHNDQVFGLAKVTSVVITEEAAEITDPDTNTTTTGTKYTITGTLELCEMVISANGAGLYEAGEKRDSQVLCPLTQNIPQAISALVYLDGNDVTSADVLAEGNVEGKLNLQFASDAELVPMENSALRTGSGTTTESSEPASSEAASEESSGN